MAQHIHGMEAREQATLRYKIIPYCWGTRHVFMKWVGLQDEKRPGTQAGGNPTALWTVSWRHWGLECPMMFAGQSELQGWCTYFYGAHAQMMSWFYLDCLLIWEWFGRLGLNEWWGVLGALPKSLLGTAPGGIQGEDRDWRPAKRRGAVSWPLAVAPGTGSSKSQSTWRLEGQQAPASLPVWPSCLGLEIWPPSRLSIRGLLCGPEA